MIIDVKVPQLSESVAEATLVSWHKQEGQAVARDENLIDIETDKVVLELPAPEAGVLVKILKGNGDTVVAGEVIAQLDTEAKAAAGAAAAAPAQAAAVPPKLTSAPAAAPAGPAARKLMAEKGLDAAAVEGSGRGGRVTKADVMEAGLRPAAPAAPAAPARPALAQPAAPVNVDAIVGERTEQRVPMSRLRARIAERLVQSQSTAAILTTFNEVNMAPVMELRNKYKDKFEKEHGVKLGFMSFFVKAAVAALKKYPVLNASIDGNDIVYHGYFDIGIAVGSPRGLVVPILRDADQMSLADIEKKIAEFGAKAKDGKLSIEELTGGTFSISNGGVFGSMLSTPIINPPQSAILGIHATKDRAVVENGQIVVRPMNYLAMSYDHRIIDGREAVLGLVTMKEALEDPARLLLEI
ncbi:MAG: dihydrolipoyllysine-residue succinyltransferase component of 2-oxoglutarate dehydrogenase complex [Rhodocyclaceae bacterium]|jgi:2-oxoglutarate dehydrogenase E2 component (dihydrolipoamide succinyltransferase)|uniref:Dihydrolipoyllysine-residue succinyltransferase component of 2-oxoglutarate dehydrogenase complex n=1 Tax=Candidatus Desulfobacillus denitrificans TaxID=2608985 RepID=A0A809RXL3_9PROT|nr:dihydrolipoamide succinyltransferase [Candidatus Desulfobacillus denitrificans]GIK46976.1 MAG: dihydrolipoyllysine-residue succinyltransferase component of 2-oxoglutarate dehydrogenase complex [Betaproteobacteria bacterium]GJQ53556.1 MAG: dihydrolipoyllysine-residue succinyltransferase component of 2-oxoglutarate dehydrogenase complex [Rhodocyclaceae bacterium]